MRKYAAYVLPTVCSLFAAFAATALASASAALSARAAPSASETVRRVTGSAPSSSGGGGCAARVSGTAVHFSSLRRSKYAPAARRPAAAGEVSMNASVTA